jgi:O-antigen/teichoic acid export membrane protein
VSGEILGLAKKMIPLGILLSGSVYLIYPTINLYFFDGKYPGLGLPAAVMTLARTVAAISSACVVVLTARSQSGDVLRVTLLLAAAGLAANTTLVYLAGVSGAAASMLGIEIVGCVLFLVRLHSAGRFAP